MFGGEHVLLLTAFETGRRKMTYFLEMVRLSGLRQTMSDFVVSLLVYIIGRKLLVSTFLSNTMLPFVLNADTGMRLVRQQMKGSVQQGMQLVLLGLCSRSGKL